MRSGRWGPYRQASPPPARHCPGARSAHRGVTAGLIVTLTAAAEGEGIAGYHSNWSALGAQEAAITNSVFAGRTVGVTLSYRKNEERGAEVSDGTVVVTTAARVR